MKNLCINLIGIIPGSAGKLGPSGLLQGAARWSKLAETCPQIRGVVVDDFWTNYDCNNSTALPSNLPCPRCPINRRFQYGGVSEGVFCCAYQTSGGHCTAPPGKPVNAPCCLVPGSAKGCQSIDRCGTNPRT